MIILGENRQNLTIGISLKIICSYKFDLYFYEMSSNLALALDYSAGSIYNGKLNNYD